MFQIHPLPAEDFSGLNSLSDAQLAEQRIQVHVSDGAYPCRVTLEDVPKGERVYLLNYEHQPADSPYKSRHAIFVKENAASRTPAAGEIPDSIASRLLSVRAFNKDGVIMDADVTEGAAARPLIEAYLTNPEIDYLHLHYAKRGCFAAKVTR